MKKGIFFLDIFLFWVTLPIQILKGKADLFLNYFSRQVFLNELQNTGKNYEMKIEHISFMIKTMICLMLI